LDTHQREKELHRFIVLVPHRDSLRPIEEYRVRLFAAGFPGAHSFPMAAPLASVSRFFSADELKELGRTIRELTKKTDGRIQSERSVVTEFTTEGTEEEEQKYLSFYGLSMNPIIEESSFSPTARAKVLKTFSPPVFCAALLGTGEKPPSEEGPALSFRVASLANLAIRPLESGASSYSFEWKIGPPFWLPKA